MNKKKLLLLLAMILLLTGIATPTLAETNATYDLSWWTVDSGGATGLTFGDYILSATAGQPDAGALSAGDYDLAGGFWAVLMEKMKSFLPMIKK